MGTRLAGVSCPIPFPCRFPRSLEGCLLIPLTDVNSTAPKAELPRWVTGSGTGTVSGTIAGRRVTALSPTIEPAVVPHLKPVRA